MNNILLYIGSLIIAVWGIAHLFPTKGIIKSFGDISADKKRIIAMGWIVEGVMMAAIGGLVFIMTALGLTGNLLALLVYRYLAVVILILAVISFFTGFRTSVIPMKICPFVKLLSMLLIVLGSGV